MSAIFAKLACYGSTRMEGQELNAYFNFLKSELRNSVSLVKFNFHFLFSKEQRVHQHFRPLLANDAED
jgi:hypothetical protein